MTSVVLSADHRSIEVVRAGHPGGILLRTPSDIRWLEVPGGPALGLRKQSGTWQKTTLAVEERTALVLFTDGLFEARVDELDRLGEDGLLAYAAPSAVPVAERNSSIPSSPMWSRSRHRTAG